MQLSPSIFRAYDIRGVVGDTLSKEVVYQIAQALGSLLQRQGKLKIAIARDGRLSSPELAKSLCEGLLSTGCHVYDLGLVPTPVLYYMAATETQSAIMLTGSHNPPEYNGLKIVVDNVPFADENIQQLYQLALQEDFVQAQGKYYSCNIVPAYINAIKQNITLSKKLKMIVDAGNGATSLLAPALYRALGMEVHELFCEIDGTFPNHHPDPSDPINLQKLREIVCAEQADFGLAFDGDGDRLGVVTNQGEIIFADRLLMLLAKYLLNKNPQAKVIYDIKCTHHLDALIRENAGFPIMWKTGHAFIKNKLKETNALLAGEMSGHFFFKDRWFGFDDALYAGARLAEILANENKSVQELFNEIPKSLNTPELKIAVNEEEKFSLMQQLKERADFKEAREINDIDGVRVNFQEGWGLVRPSNTTPYLVLRFEAVNEKILENIQTIFREWILSVKPDLVLPF